MVQRRRSVHSEDYSICPHRKTTRPDKYSRRSFIVTEKQVCLESEVVRFINIFGRSQLTKLFQIQVYDNYCRKSSE